MKLGALKTAIRALKTAPKAIVRFGSDRRILYLDLQKTPLLERLDELFTGGRGEETGFELTEDGYLHHQRELSVGDDSITIRVSHYEDLIARAQELEQRRLQDQAGD